MIKKELIAIPVEELLTKYLGKKGTKKRIAAEKKMDELSRTREDRNEEKAFIEDIERLMDRIEVRKKSNIK